MTLARAFRPSCPDRTSVAPRRAAAALLVVLLTPARVGAQDPDDADGPGAVEETLVVTASKTEERIQDAPVAISVVTELELEQAPVRTFGDALTRVPGVNVVQFGVRDIQITPRASTGALATGQLALVDGRTIYQDFLGFIFWDIAPVDFDDIAQVEVVRGPGSAIWGANALRGVVNVRTKSPAEAEGLRLSAGFGNRDHQTYGLRWADVRGKLGYKVVASWFEQRDWPHVETINGVEVPYESPDPGTETPNLDLRLDYEVTDRDTLTFEAGSTGTTGLIMTGIGPFDIDRGSTFSYVQAVWERGDMSARLFANLVDGDARNVFAVDPATNEGILFSFDTQTYDLSFSDGVLFGTLARLVYGANARQQNMKLSIAAGGEDRFEAGVFAELQFLFNDHVWWNVGARYDWFEYSGSVRRAPADDPFTLVDQSGDNEIARASPRTSLLLRANDRHTFRFGYGQAFRVPSLVENFLSTQLGVPTGSPIIPVVSLEVFGDPELEEESLQSYDFSYNGRVGTDFTYSLNYYYTVTDDGINLFTRDEIPLSLPPPLDAIPVNLTFRNLPKIRHAGAEASVAWRINRWVDTYATYTFQRAPSGGSLPTEFIAPLDTDSIPISTPPKHSYSVGVNWNRGRVFGSVSGTYRGEAFWTDVLTSDFWGPSDSWFWTNANLGVRLLDDRLTWTVGATNLFDNPSRSHLFGDEIGGLYTTQLKMQF